MRFLRGEERVALQPDGKSVAYVVNDAKTFSINRRCSTDGREVGATGPPPISDSRRLVLRWALPRAMLREEIAREPLHLMRHG
jgi:hypothetical protein